VNLPDLALPRPRLPVLTSLRFFAAFHVVLFHLQATKIAFLTGPLANFASIGYIGVSFFFVLSGFILVYTYAGRPLAKPQFWRARFARIYPAYAFSLFFTAPFFFFAIFNMKIPFFTFAAAHPIGVSLLVLSLLQSWVPAAALSWNTVAWSLSVEAFFYLLFPFLLPALLQRKRTLLVFFIVTCWLVSLGLATAYIVYKPDGLAHVDADVLLANGLNVLKFNPLVRLPEFLLGMATGILFLGGSNRPQLALALVAIAVIGFVAAAHFSHAIPYPILHTGFLSPLFAAFIYGLALRPSWSTFLENRVLVLLGDASYSLYLLHAAILPMFFLRPDGKVHNNGPLGIILAVLVVIGLCVLVYRFIEEPARRKLNPRHQKDAPQEQPAFA